MIYLIIWCLLPVLSISIIELIIDKRLTLNSVMLGIGYFWLGPIFIYIAIKALLENETKSVVLFKIGKNKND